MSNDIETNPVEPPEVLEQQPVPPEGLWHIVISYEDRPSWNNGNPVKVRTPIFAFLGDEPAAHHLVGLIKDGSLRGVTFRYTDGRHSGYYLKELVPVDVLGARREDVEITAELQEKPTPHEAEANAIGLRDSANKLRDQALEAEKVARAAESHAAAVIERWDAEWRSRAKCLPPPKPPAPGDPIAYSEPEGAPVDDGIAF